jgi:hypothetical protein
MISTKPPCEANSDRGKFPPNMADDFNVVATPIARANGPLQLIGIER